jgi:hypothetical protein
MLCSSLEADVILALVLFPSDPATADMAADLDTLLYQAHPAASANTLSLQCHVM